MRPMYRSFLLSFLHPPYIRYVPRQPPAGYVLVRTSWLLGCLVKWLYIKFSIKMWIYCQSMNAAENNCHLPDSDSSRLVQLPSAIRHHFWLIVVSPAVIIEISFYGRGSLLKHDIFLIRSASRRYMRSFSIISEEILCRLPDPVWRRYLE